MTSCLEDLLSKTFAACGEDPARAARLAKAAAATIQAIDIVPVTSMEAFELDAKIYDLRGKNVTQSALMERLGITKDRIYAGLRRGMKRRRDALRSMEQDDEPLLKVG
jgi:hypothetical protein